MGVSQLRNSSRPGRAALGLLALAMIGLLAAQGCALSSPGLEVGDIAPDFTLADLEGNDVTLSELRGKTVLINFWATWCPPCRAEMPEIEALYQEYKDREVVVIGVDIRESRDKVHRFVQQGGYSWTFVIDTTGEVSRNYGITAIPTSFFVDREGLIREVNIGAMTKRAMEAKLAEAMK